MKSLLFIALGGAGGALARYGLYWLVHGAEPVRFPWATLAVNVVGSFLIGIAYVTIVERGLIHPDWRGVLMVGFLGAFTTFSTFSLESLALFEAGNHALALAYIGISLLLCLVSVWAGLSMMRLL
ncbi:MAG: fluoride efflux transporter CrcB [Pseudomonadota bacterium]